MTPVERRLEGEAVSLQQQVAAFIAAGLDEDLWDVTATASEVIALVAETIANNIDAVKDHADAAGGDPWALGWDCGMSLAASVARQVIPQTQNAQKEDAL